MRWSIYHCFTIIPTVYVQCFNRRSLKHSSVSRWTWATHVQGCQRYRGMSGILGVVRTPQSRSGCPEWIFWMAGWGCFVVMPRARWKSWRRKIQTPWNRRPWESSSLGAQNTGSPLLQTCSRIECMTFSDLFVRIHHVIWDRTNCDSEKEQMVPY